ncbi:hypothetical protein BH20ACT24_BH20ACT24_08450 [soil metagenome]
MSWGTWDAEYPGAYLHRGSGLSIRISAFSSRASRYTDFPFDPGVALLGPHRTDGSYAELELAHEGSAIRVRFACPAEDTAFGDVQVLRTGEWGLRFWYVLAVGFAEDGEVRLLQPEGEARYVLSPVAVASTPTGAIAFSCDPRPVGAHLYDDPADGAREFEQHGYYARPQAREAGRLAVFRFNAVTPLVTFAATVAAEPGAAAREVRRRLAGREAADAGPIDPPHRAAIRDVLGWNTVLDPANRRPYTCATRGWVGPKFGGWAVWQLDSFLSAILAARIGDSDLARANLEAALSLATERGNLAALASGTTHWQDRSHPPIGALASWAVFELTGDRSVLERSVDVLTRAFFRWFEERDGNGNRLLEYGSSPVGDGHFVHTKLAAMDESAMDNSPVHDEATFDVTTHTLDVEDVGLNSLLVLEGEMLSRASALLGDRPDQLVAVETRTEDLRSRVRGGLWDPDRQVFANRLWDGRFARSLAPTSFYPMLAGIATKEQAEAMVRHHLLDTTRFWGEHPVAGTPHDDPAASDNVYWRGRVWPPFNYLVYRGLRRYGYDDVAGELAKRSVAMFDREWANRRCYENYNQRTGEGGDSVDSDPFYTWGALLPMLADMELLDRDPWNGVTFGRPHRIEAGGPDAAELATADARYRVEVDAASTRLLVDGTPVFQTAASGRFRLLRLDRPSGTSAPRAVVEPHHP